VIVAVLPARVVQVSFHEIIQMVSVPDLFVPAVRTVNVIPLVRFALVVRRTTILICSAYFQYMLVDVILMYMMQMAVVEIVCMAVVLDSRVSALRAVDVSVLFLFHTLSGRHRVLLYRAISCRR
jgi:hypothetical protein